MFNTSGTNPAPIPWILCGPGLPPERTGESFGSTAITSMSGNFSFSTSPVPVTVPPVPTPAINASKLKPSNASIISGPVVKRCASTFAGFSNC